MGGSNIKELHNRLSRSSVNRVIVLLLRIIVGATFIFSGFVKAIDPTGSVYKFHEYIAALDYSWLAGSEVVLAFAVPLLEVVLGVMMLTGCCRRGTPRLLFLLMMVMTPLTLFLAITNSVPDCGCFGDAILLSNWATFWKNVALTIAIIYLIFFNKSFPSLYGPAIQWIVMLLTFATALAIAFTGYSVQPLIDFRPYKVGSNISAHATAPTENDFVFIYEKDGKQQEFAIDDVPDEEDGWTYIDRKSTKPELTLAQKAELNALSIYDNGTDVTDEVLDSTQNQLLILMPEMDKVNKAYAFTLDDLAQACSRQNTSLMVITSALSTEIEQWNSLTQPSYPIYTGDDSEIKMLARGNPAVAFVKNGTIMWKRTLSSLRAASLIKAETPLEQLSDDFNPATKLWEILAPYFLLMVALLFVNRIYPVVNFIITKIKKLRNKH